MLGFIRYPMIRKTHPKSLGLMIAACLTIAVGTTAIAPSETQAQSRTVTVNPLDLVNGLVNFELEGAVTPFVSLYGGANFFVWDGVWDNRKGSTFAVGPEIGVRLFPFAGAPAGFWLGPFGGLAYVRSENNGHSNEAVGYSIGGMVGITFILFKLLVLSLGVGAGFHRYAADVEDERIGVVHVLPRFRFSVGFAF